MVFSYQDRQFIDMKRLQDATAPIYSDPAKYMNDPGAVSYEMKGRVQHNAMRTQDQVALTQYYIENIPVLWSIWNHVVALFISTHTASQVNTAGIFLPRGGPGFIFRSSVNIYSFFNMEIASEFSI